MELRITFDELSNIIEQKAGRRLTVVYGGPHTVRVSYDVNVLFSSASVGLDLTVESVNNGNITLAYNGGMGIDFMVRQALSMAKKKPGGEMIEQLDGNRLLLALGKNGQAGSLLDHIDLRDIRFDEHYAIVEFEPKNV